MFPIIIAIIGQLSLLSQILIQYGAHISSYYITSNRFRNMTHFFIIINITIYHYIFLSNIVHIPSGELTFCHGKSTCLMGKSTISMAIFNSYVSSPEGSTYIYHQWIWPDVPPMFIPTPPSYAKLLRKWWRPWSSAQKHPRSPGKMSWKVVKSREFYGIFSGDTLWLCQNSYWKWP